jgi:hypothetical protein
MSRKELIDELIKFKSEKKLDYELAFAPFEDQHPDQRTFILLETDYNAE